MGSVPVTKGPQRRWMRLGLVRGKLLTNDAGGGTGGSGCGASAGAIMDAEVWSRLPEDILWRVIQRLPAAKHFQLHLVSRKWREVLTSAEFRARIGEPVREDLQRAIAYVIPSDNFSVDTTTSGINLKDYLDIDLSSFVPDGFLDPNQRYFVMAAANGLVCISNQSKLKHSTEALWIRSNQYCVVNPLTRTCIVLPTPPFMLEAVPEQWLPPSTTTLTICRYRREQADWAVATYDLAAGGAGRWVVAGRISVPPFPGPHAYQQPGALAVSAGETYWIDGVNSRVHVLAPGGGPDVTLVDAAAPLDAPSVALLGLDPASFWYFCQDAFLVVHRGAVFLVVHLMDRGTDPDSDVACCLWRLARDRMEWEGVARLDVPQMKRVTGCVHYSRSRVVSACGVRELLCTFHRVAFRGREHAKIYVLGFNLDTGEWDLVHNDDEALAEYRFCNDSSLKVVDPFELRPDLFL